LSYQPFLQGPGRVNDYVKLDGSIYKVTHVDDVFIPRIGWNSVNLTWQDSVFNAIAAGGDTSFRDLPFTSVQELRLLQLTGIEISAPWALLSLKQPSKMTRWGAGNEPEGTINAIQSPMGAPLFLRELFSVQNKPVQLRCRNQARAHPLVPMLHFRGFLYELEAYKGAAGVWYEPPIGGIE
jgi:hypothetical protein